MTEVRVVASDYLIFHTYGKSSRSQLGERLTPSQRVVHHALDFSFQGCIHRLLRNGNYSERVGVKTPVFLVAVLEYWSAEVLDLAGNVVRNNKKCRIYPRHLQLSIHNDDELNKFLGGVLPNIQSVLLPKKTTKKA